jgi:hypothetical protein
MIEYIYLLDEVELKEKMIKIHEWPLNNRVGY